MRLHSIELRSKHQQIVALQDENLHSSEQYSLYETENPKNLMQFSDLLKEVKVETHIPLKRQCTIEQVGHLPNLGE